MHTNVGHPYQVNYEHIVVRVSRYCFSWNWGVAAYGSAQILIGNETKTVYIDLIMTMLVL